MRMKGKKKIINIKLLLEGHLEYDFAVKCFDLFCLSFLNKKTFNSINLQSLKR